MYQIIPQSSPDAIPSAWQEHGQACPGQNCRYRGRQELRWKQLRSKGNPKGNGEDQGASLTPLWNVSDQSLLMLVRISIHDEDFAWGEYTPFVTIPTGE